MAFGPDVWARIQLWEKQSLWLGLGLLLKFIYLLSAFVCVHFCVHVCGWVHVEAEVNVRSPLLFLSQGLSVSVRDPPDSTSLP